MSAKSSKFVLPFILLWTWSGAGCAKQEAARESAARASLERNRTVLLASAPTRRYSNANGEGWVEEWQIVDVTPKELVKHSRGRRTWQCAVKFRVKRWEVQNDQKLEPPVERFETQEWTLPGTGGD